MNTCVDSINRPPNQSPDNCRTWFFFLIQDPFRVPVLLQRFSVFSNLEQPSRTFLWFSWHWLFGEDSRSMVFYNVVCCGWVCLRSCDQTERQPWWKGTPRRVGALLLPPLRRYVTPRHPTPDHSLKRTASKPLHFISQVTSYWPFLHSLFLKNNTVTSSVWVGITLTPRWAYHHGYLLLWIALCRISSLLESPFHHHQSVKISYRPA